MGVRSSDVLLDKISPETDKVLRKYCTNFQEQVRWLLNCMILMRGKSYLYRNEEGKIIERTEAEVHAKRAEIFPNPESWDLLQQYYDASVGTKNNDKFSSLMLFEGSRSGDGVNYKSCYYRWFKSIKETNLSWEEASELLQYKEKLQKNFKEVVSDLDGWKSIYDRYINGESIESLCLELQGKNPDKGISAGKTLLKMGVFPLHMPHGYFSGAYTKAVWAAGLSSLLSWEENSVLRRNEKQDLQNKFNAKLEEVNAAEYELFLQFINDCTKENFGIGKRFMTAVSKLKNFSDVESNEMRLGLKILAQDKYSVLQNKERFSSLFYCYLAQKCFEKRNWSSCLPNFEKVPFDVMFGMTGRNSKFEISSENNRFYFTIDVGKKMNLVAKPSNYFKYPKIDTIHGGFAVTFTKGKRQILGEIKEIKLVMKINGEGRSSYYIRLPYSFKDIEVPQSAKQSQSYFRSSIGENDSKIKEVPFGLRTLGIDLNINPVLSLTLMELQKEKLNNISIPVDGLGYMNMIDKVHIGESYSSSIYSQIKSLREELHAFKNVLRVAKNIYFEKPLTEWDINHRAKNESLCGFASLPDDARERFILLSHKISELKNRFNKIRDEFSRRDYGFFENRICSEFYQMLFLIKDMISVLKSWNRFKDNSGKWSVIPNECNYYYTYYNNLKDDFLKKIVFSVIDYAKKNHVSIILMEDLSIGQDAAKTQDENKLTSVWSPHIIRSTIESYALCEGILVQEVDPKYTSQISPIGEFGYRDKNDKTKLYFVQNDKLHQVDADFNGSYNLHRKFCTRYKTMDVLWAKKISSKVVQELFSVDHIYLIESTGKRVASFLNRNSGDKFACLIWNGKSFNIHPVSASNYKKLTENSKKKVKGSMHKFYRHSGSWISRDSHENEIRSIHDLLIGGEKAKVFELACA